MKFQTKISSVIAGLAVASAILSGCSQKELDTDQYPSGETKLASWGPNPVMRGATLSFYGSCLETVKQVNVPGADPITDIEVITSGTPSEIRIQLPAEGSEVGYITLVTDKGKTLTTQNEVEYIEPIVLDSFSTESKPAMPGDVLSLKGDYMNLVASVIFEGGQEVAVEEGADRHNASVVIPASAVSGKIVLSDGNSIPNLIYSEEVLEIGLPTVTSMTVAEALPGEPVIISGKYLQMIDKVVFEGDVTVEHADFTLNEENTTLTLSLPAEAADGDVKAISYSSDEYKLGALETVKPSNLVVAPAPAKAGSEMTISGNNLDIVSDIALSNAGSTTFFEKEGVITLTVPAKAATEGKITLTMKNGESVTAEYSLVFPEITEIAPVDIMAGETVTVKGADLDLIVSAKLGGKDVTIVREEGAEVSETEMTIATENTSVSGKFVFTLANGETVEPETEIKISYDSFIIVKDMPAAEHIGALVTLKGENFLMIENIFIGEAKVTRYTMRSDNEITFFMPYNTVGTYDMYFHLTTGEVETCPNKIEVLLEQVITVGWEGTTEITWGDGGRVIVPASKFEGVKAGTKMRIYFTQKDQTWAQAQFNYGDWSGINFDDPAGVTFNQTIVPTDVFGWFEDGILDRCVEVVLTKGILANIQSKQGECEGQTGCGVIIQGSDLIFTKIEIVSEISQETTVWEGEFYTGPDYNNNGELGTENDWINAGLYEGATVKVYFTAGTPEDWSIQLFSGHWSGLTMLFPGTDNPNQFNSTTAPTAVSDGYISFVVTEELFNIFTEIQNWGSALIVQGKDITFTRIAFI